MGRSNISGGGGIDINGIIEEYKVASGENISAGDFVEFINNYEVQDDTQIGPKRGTSGTRISAVELSNNKIFIAHPVDGNRYLYGIICTINGTTITYGTNTELNSNAASGIVTSVIKLNGNKVFIAHGSGGYLYGMICTISDTVITVESDIQLSSANYSGSYISAVALSETEVFISHSWAYFYKLYGIICTINGTVVTPGTDTLIVDVEQSAVSISASKISNTKIFITHGTASDSSSLLYGIICTISSTTITPGADTQLNSSGYAGYISFSTVLSSTKVFIAHSYTSDSSNNNYSLYGIVCSINGTVLTPGTDTQLSSNDYSGSQISATTLSNNKVFITHGNSSSYYLYGMFCIIDGTIISIDGTDIQLSSIQNTSLFMSTLTLSSNYDIFVIHSYYGGKNNNHYLYGILLNNNKKILPVTSLSQEIVGIAKTSGISGDTIQVYVPDYN